MSKPPPINVATQVPPFSRGQNHSLVASEFGSTPIAISHPWHESPIVPMSLVFIGSIVAGVFSVFMKSFWPLIAIWPMVWGITQLFATFWQGKTGSAVTAPKIFSMQGFTSLFRGASGQKAPSSGSINQ
jgi:hypothetical protein